jgi:polysaccharide transporter, PST family
MSSLQSKNDFKNKAVKSGVVTVSAQMVTIAIQLASIVILSRLLSPADFGTIAMIAAITAFVGLFRDMGLSTASIQKKELSYEQSNLLFWINILAGMVLMFVLMALSPVIAWFYDKPELKPVALLLSVTFLIASASAQHSALMQRAMRFKPKAVAEIGGAFLTLLLSSVLAILGYGYWSLAWGTVAGALLTSLLFFVLSDFRPGLPKKAEGVREMLGFGANITAFEFVNYFHRNLDNVLIGRVWGAEALGLYSRAYQMMMLPLNSLRAPINAVALPVLSKLQNDPLEFRRYYCKITSLLAMLSMPLMAFLVVNADDVVLLALGKQWVEVVPIFMLLGLAGFIQPVASLRGLVLISLGFTKRYLAWGVINTILVCVAFFIGLPWGGVGVACAYVIANYLILYPSLIWIFKGTPIAPVNFFVAVSLPFLSSIVASGVSYAVMNQLDLNNLFLRFLVSGLLFVACFILVLAILPSGRLFIKSFIEIGKMLKKPL